MYRSRHPRILCRQGLFISSVIFCTSLLWSTEVASGKNVYRPSYRIVDNVKHLNLTSAEIDPEVAPPTASNNVEIVNLNDGNLDYMVDDHIAEAELINGGSVSSVSLSPDIYPSTTSMRPPSTTAQSIIQSENPISKYCKCVENHCSCCRNFNIPIIPIKGPGCAKISYLGDDRMSVTLKYGDITLASRTISSKRARPICIGLPGGFSRFCGRFYGLSKTQDNFKACLGLELRADDVVEASMRVSCFKFGPEGLRVAEAEPYPTSTRKPPATESEDDEDEDDDDDDDEEESEGDGLFGLGVGSASENEEDDDEGDDEYEYDDDGSAASTELLDAINETDIIRRDGQKRRTNSTKKHSSVEDDNDLNLTNLFNPEDDEDDDKNDDDDDDDDDDEDDDDEDEEDDDDDDDDDDEVEESDGSNKDKKKNKKKNKAPLPGLGSRLPVNVVQSKGDDSPPGTNLAEAENCGPEGDNSASVTAVNNKDNSAKKRKAKKDKKNKKSSEDADTLAYDILDGLFDFFK